MLFLLGVNAFNFFPKFPFWVPVNRFWQTVNTKMKCRLISQGFALFSKIKTIFVDRNTTFIEILPATP